MYKELPKRKVNRLRGYDYSRAACYFVTICVRKRDELLGEVVGDTVLGVPCAPIVRLNEFGKVVDGAIKYYNNMNGGVIFDKYIIMPNHVHMIVVLCGETGDRGRSPLQYIVRNLKSYVTKQIGFSPWQKSFHDRIIRNEEEYRQMREYINENPANWDNDEYHSRIIP